MKDLKIDSESKKIETEIYRARLNELNLLPNKQNLDLFFVAFEKKSEIQNSRNIFGQKAGKWILQTHNADGTPALAIKEFASKRKALTFIKNSLTGNFLICVRYKRDFERELADVPVQFYMHNLEDNIVKQVIFRYEWKYIFDTSASTKEYFEKFEKFILGEVKDDERTVEVKEEKAPLVSNDELVANEVPKEFNVAKFFVYLGILCLFAATLVLWIYALINKTDDFKDYLIGFGASCAALFFIAFVVEVAMLVKKHKNHKLQSTAALGTKGKNE